MRRRTDPWWVLEHGPLTLADDDRALVRSADRNASIAGIPLSADSVRNDIREAPNVHRLTACAWSFYILV